jgi:hypothetical protein
VVCDIVEALGWAFEQANLVHCFLILNWFAIVAFSPPFAVSAHWRVSVLSETGSEFFLVVTVFDFQIVFLHRAYLFCLLLFNPMAAVMG